MNFRRIIIGGHSVVCAVLAVAWLLCAGVDSSIAAPTVSSVSGTVANGQTITITGTNFGSGPTVGGTTDVVLLFDDFEKGTNGSVINPSGTTAAEVGEWTYTGDSTVPGVNGVPPVYSTSQKVSGNNAAYMTNPNPDTDWNQRLIALIPSGANPTQIFISWWMWIDNQSGNWKVMWPMNNCCSAYDFYAPAYWGFGNGIYASNWLSANDLYQNYNIPNVAASTWKRTWQYIDGTGSSPNFYSWELTSSGVVADATPTNCASYSTGSNCGWFNMDGSSSESWQEVLVNGYMGSDATSHIYFDDIYIAYGPHSRARVEIGNAATYNACTNLAIATPTAWGASSITATVWKGSFSSSASAYLYVVDSTNTPNANGYPITFGGGSATPATPGGLHLEE
jgi:hypothetical protein